jgi:hypothetical protein
MVLELHPRHSANAAEVSIGRAVSVGPSRPVSRRQQFENKRIVGIATVHSFGRAKPAVFR